jgi:hypothetical protein
MNINTYDIVTHHYIYVLLHLKARIVHALYMLILSCINIFLDK